MSDAHPYGPGWSSCSCGRDFEGAGNRCDECEWLRRQRLARPRGGAPTLRALTAELRRLSALYDGPGPVGLDVDGQVQPWPHPTGGLTIGRYELPGDDLPFDAVRTARLLLAAFRDYLTEDAKS